MDLANSCPDMVLLVQPLIGEGDIHKIYGRGYPRFQESQQHKMINYIKKAEQLAYILKIL